MMGSLASLCLGAVIVGMGLSVVLWVDIAVERQCWEELGGYTWMDGENSSSQPKE